MIVLARGVVLTAELFDSAVERVCDFMERGSDERIGAIKDVALAAVGVSILGWLVVVCYELPSRSALLTPGEAVDPAGARRPTVPEHGPR